MSMSSAVQPASCVLLWSASSKRFLYVISNGGLCLELRRQQKGRVPMETRRDKAQTGGRGGMGLW